MLLGVFLVIAPISGISADYPDEHFGNGKSCGIRNGWKIATFGEPSSLSSSCLLFLGKDAKLALAEAQRAKIGKHWSSRENKRRGERYSKLNLVLKINYRQSI